jgi:hypothetical protein
MSQTAYFISRKADYSKVADILLAELAKIKGVKISLDCSPSRYESKAQAELRIKRDTVHAILNALGNGGLLTRNEFED